MPLTRCVGKYTAAARSAVYLVLLYSSTHQPDPGDPFVSTPSVLPHSAHSSRTTSKDKDSRRRKHVFHSGKIHHAQHNFQEEHDFAPTLCPLVLPLCDPISTCCSYCTHLVHLPALRRSLTRSELMAELAKEKHLWRRR